MMKIVSVSGSPVSAEVEKDYANAPAFDKLRIGNTGVFFPSGFRMSYIPYDSFDCSYVKVHDTKARMCCATTGFEYFRIVFMSGEKCIGDYLSEDKEAMQAALDQLRISAPGIQVGLK
ncbi:MAG: hypothetical protein Q4F31_10790 [Eubacteriales bacterium]|nr:hypothetical protein [Eubacteriales bacterium]